MNPFRLKIRLPKGVVLTPLSRDVFSIGETKAIKLTPSSHAKVRKESIIIVPKHGILQRPTRVILKTPIQQLGIAMPKGIPIILPKGTNVQVVPSRKVKIRENRISALASSDIILSKDIIVTLDYIPPSWPDKQKESPDKQKESPDKHTSSDTSQK